MGSDSAETARLVKAVGEDVVSFATQGGLLTKFPFGEGAAPKVRFFQASDDGMYLLWGDAKQAGNLPSRLALAEVEAIVQGTRTLPCSWLRLPPSDRLISDGVGWGG